MGKHGIMGEARHASALATVLFIVLTILFYVEILDGERLLESLGLATIALFQILFSYHELKEILRRRK